MKHQTAYSIGDVSSICHIPIKTLRYYDQIGLVQPSAKNESTGYRYYEKEQLLQIHLVKHLKELRFSLGEIQNMLDTRNITYLQACVQKKLEDLNTQIQLLRTVHLSGQFFLERIQQGSSILKHLEGSVTPIEFSVATLEVERISEQNVIFSRNTQHNYRNEEAHVDRWGELIELVRREQAVMMGPLFVIYHQQPLEQFYSNVCDYEVCIPIMNMNPSDSSHYRHDKSFQAVTSYHVGSYNGLIHPYMMAMQWIRKNGYLVNGPMRDAFLVSPIDTQNSDEYITKIIIPVRKQD